MGGLALTAVLVLAAGFNGGALAQTWSVSVVNCIE